jgi:hypothetical protein
MFNPRRILRFLGPFLGFSLLVFIAIFVLAGLTEVFTHSSEMPQLFGTPGFWLSVVYNILPALLVLCVMLAISGHFMQSVYHLPTWTDGMQALLHLRFGLWSFQPWMKIEQGKPTLNANGVIAFLGGPGNLIVNNDSALVLQQKGRLSRVVGPGFVQLKDQERIYDIIDLRPRRFEYEVSAMTREGIPIKWNVEVRLQIEDGGQAASESMPFPFSEEAVLKAATCKWRREASFAHGQDMNWEGMVVVSQAEGILRSILARRPLDQLIGLTSDERAAREPIQEELKQELRQVASRYGARILEVKLDNLKVTNVNYEADDAATLEWIKHWKTRWQGWSLHTLAPEEARRIYLYDTAKAEAQSHLISRLAREIQDADSPAAVLTRLYVALDRARAAAPSRTFVPNQALEGAGRIRQMVSGEPTSGAPSSGIDTVTLAAQLNNLTGRVARLEEQLGTKGQDA